MPRVSALIGLLALCAGLVLLWPPPRTIRAQGAAEVWLNVQKGGGAKLNMAVPTFTVVSGPNSGTGRMLADVAARDLAFTGIFSIVSGTGPLPASADGQRQAFTDFAGAGAHAVLHGLVRLRDDRAEGELRLYDLTSPEYRSIAQKKFEVPAAQVRRLAHKIADEVTLQFTGVLGVADTKIAFVKARPARAGKELFMIDYDGGVEPTALTENGSINLSPAWSPDSRSVAFTSYVKGYPDLYRLFAFERRPLQTIAAFLGINAAPAWSPDGRSVALTMSKDGNAEVYILNIPTGVVRRLTRHVGIDVEPSFSPTGRQIAFTSDRQGQPHIFVMDDEGANVRQLTSGGFHTQPRWSPRGDLIAYTARRGTHSIWLVNADGSNPRRLETGPGDTQSPAWSPDGRYLAYQTNRSGSWQIYTMHADGSDQRPLAPLDATSPSWSPRLP